MKKGLIFLVGMMGSGKTTLGRQLARQLGCAFVDLDAYIEQREGKTIPQLFATEGQQGFRMLERQALEALVQQYTQAVVATGGGAPCFFDNIDLINQQGLSVFLDVPVEELAKRLRRAGGQERPLLQGKTGAAELTAFLQEILAQRRRFYERAKAGITGVAIDINSLLYLVENH